MTSKIHTSVKRKLLFHKYNEIIHKNTRLKDLRSRGATIKKNKIKSYC